MKRVFILLFFVSISFDSFAQEPLDILLEGGWGWNLSHLEIDGDIIFVPTNSEFQSAGFEIAYITQTNFYELYAGACNYTISPVSDLNNTSFSSTTFDMTYNNCILPETLAFETVYFEAFFKINDPSHTFTYEIDTTTPNTRYLTVTNEEGDIAYYFGETLLGLEEAVEKTLSIFPNPTGDQLNILSNHTNFENISIFNIQGQEVMTVKFQQNQRSIDTSGLQTGVYFLKAESDTGQQLTAKFIKK